MCILCRDYIDLLAPTPRRIPFRITVRLFFGGYLFFLWFLLCVFILIFWVSTQVSVTYYGVHHPAIVTASATTALTSFTARIDDFFRDQRVGVAICFILISMYLFIPRLQWRGRLYHLLKWGQFIQGTIITKRVWTEDVMYKEVLWKDFPLFNVEVAYHDGRESHQLVQRTRYLGDNIIGQEVPVLYNPSHPAHAYALVPDSEHDDLFSCQAQTACSEGWPLPLLLIAPITVLITIIFTLIACAK